MFDCDYCDKSFASKYALKRHRTHPTCQRAKELFLKLCIEKERNASLSTITDRLANKEVELTREIELLKYRLKQQDDEYKTKLNEQVMHIDYEKTKYAELRESYDQMTKTLLDRATGKTNTTNMTNNIFIQNLQPLAYTYEELYNIFTEGYTRQHLQQGIPGLVNFVAEQVVMRNGDNLYAISDFNRCTGTYISPEHGGLVKDVKCRDLTTMVKEPCTQRIEDIIKEEEIPIQDSPMGNGDMWSNLESKNYRRIKHLSSDDKEFVVKLASRIKHVSC